MKPNAGESCIGLVLEGRVQGVGFRWWTLGTARRLGLRGTVRNLLDGSVEVQAAGPEEALATFEAALRRGPPGATVLRVSRVSTTAVLPPDFRVLG